MCFIYVLREQYILNHSDNFSDSIRSPPRTPIKACQKGPFLAGNAPEPYFYYGEEPVSRERIERSYVDSDSEISGAALRVYPHLEEETSRFQPTRSSTPIPAYLREWNEDPSANLSEIESQMALEPYGETYPRPQPPSWCNEPFSCSDIPELHPVEYADSTGEYYKDMTFS